MERTTEQVKTILERHDEIQIALVFGSRVEGRARPDSDLDIGVAARKPLSALEQLDLIDELAAAFGRPIDLIDLLTSAAPILRQILTKGVFILKKTPTSTPACCANYGTTRPISCPITI